MRKDLDTVRYILMTVESAEGEVDDSACWVDRGGKAYAAIDGYLPEGACAVTGHVKTDIDGHCTSRHARYSVS